MDFSTTVDLIIRDLNEAREIIDDLKNYPGVPALQVELAKSKCKSAAEVIELLKYLQGQTTSEKKDTIPPAAVKKEVTAKRMQESPKYDDSDLKTEVVRSSTASAKKIPVRSSKKASESVIIADTFSHLPNSLNEQLGSQKDEEDLTDLIKTKPITKLSEAIGVNDRFLFIRELFNGDPESYNRAISNLDNSQNLADARAVIMSYAGNDTETEAVKQLLNLVKRKFPADE
jgi:hypothetical protein